VVPLPATRSGGDSQKRPKELGRKVGTTWPDHRTQLGVKGDVAEVPFITERLEDLTVEFTSKVDFTFKTVRES
jgi:hypothetical protein